MPPRRALRAGCVNAVAAGAENPSRLDGLAEALLRDETLDQPQAYAAAGLTRPPEDEAMAVEAAAPVAT